MSLSDQVASKLETSRKELLDLTFRNPLLNYRPLKAQGVEVIETEAAAVFQTLVRESKKLPFLAADQDPIARNRIEEDADETAEDSLFEAFFRELDASAAGAGDQLTIAGADTPSDQLPNALRRKRSSVTLTALKTASSPTDLQKRLLTTLYTARSFIEEQGVNTLFLALGMLTWYEADSSQVCHCSPLLLVPMELERASASDRFYLRYTGDDATANVSLRALLSMQFGITLPDIADDDETDVSAYLEAVRNAVSYKTRWAVQENAVHLGFFSFSKFLMYKDLEEKAWPDTSRPSDHPVITSLLTNGFNESAPRLTESDHLDEKVAPQDTKTVMDADSSQVLAIEDIKQGRNLVIQGPPGTGKSQTITNIIAEALGQGKTVLFVAEKMAALDVVKRRLDALGLGSACLELHSNKTNKKTVLAELKRTLELGRPVLGMVEEDRALLFTARIRLNSYVQIVNAPVGNSGLSLHHVYGEWLLINRELRERYAHQEATSSENQHVQLPRLDVPDFISWTSVEVRQREQIVKETQAQVAVMGIPNKHPYWGSQKTVILPSEQEDFQRAFANALVNVRDMRAKTQRLAEGLQMTPPVTPGAALALAQAVQRANAAPPFVGIQIGLGEWLTRRADLEAVVRLGMRLCALREEHTASLVPEAWEAEPMSLGEARQAVAAHGHKWYRFLLGDWRKAQKQLVLLMADGRPPKETARQLVLLDVLLEYRQTQTAFREREALGQALFGAQWQGERSEWNVLEQLLTWIVTLHQGIGEKTLPKAFLDFLAASPDLKPLELDAQMLQTAHTVAQDAVRACIRLLDLREEVLSGMDGNRYPVCEQPFSTQEAILSAWASSTERLQEIAAFNHLAAELRKAGLSSVVETASTWPDAATNLVPIYQRSYLESLLRLAYQAHPELATFSGAMHTGVLKQFQDLDLRLLQHNRRLLAERHWHSLPTMQGEGQMRVLTREFEKKARHLPLRQIIDRAGRVIQAIKPVFMMSPLSVATYLPPGQISFDLVVFDEASQVKPVDAFGALLRAKQAVVVGDSKQLPPTSFFDKLGAWEDETQDSETADMESVLGLFAAQGAPQRMLQWHYRSRHESLIAVSNQALYDNRLVIFPSPDRSREQYGLVYHHLPQTVYDRGGSGTNRLEAKIVAEAVMDHARQQVIKPQSQWLTLGVAAFSMIQMQAILAQLEMLRRLNPDCESFFNTGGQEPFFVKNLENVQGDERDIIYISVGYGRDADGKVGMNFGPLNNQGGERRLNVLITRARLRCEVFTNLTADDIDLTRSNALGIIVLKQFLGYAQTGTLSLSVPSGREPDSPFEREVLAVLDSLGYDVVPQVGCAGYFIDIAVKDPQRPGRYLLGIECDGVTYHSARSARDRDRLREEVLRRMGWQLHRIWSTDWINRYGAEVRRLHEAVETARQETAREIEIALQETPGEKPCEIELAITPDSSAQNISDAAETAILPRVTVERPIEALPDYQKISLPRVRDWPIYDQPLSHIADMVEKVVEQESPVHIQEMARRIAEAFFVERVTEKFFRTVEEAVASAVHYRRIRQSGEFLWAATMKEAPLRSRANLDSRERQVEYIAPEEIAAGVRRVVTDAYGMSFEEIAKSTSRLFGIERMSSSTKAHIEEVANNLIRHGTLKQHNGQVVPADT